jgi:acyl-CoA synthetase (AMP-forming)/AMP-acid ligase II
MMNCHEFVTSFFAIAKIGAVIVPLNWRLVPDELEFIVKKDATVTESDIIAHCDGKLARFKMPGGIRFIDVIPRKASGKALKRELRFQFPTL